MEENTRKFAVFIFLMIIDNLKVVQCESNYTLNPKILIIGAGPAGIAAASKLFENGFKNVTILEAQDRIGGRVYTTKLGDYNVDLGGQWVHGESGNVAFELAHPLGLLDKSDQPNYGLTQEYFDSAGKSLSDEIANSISNFYYKFVNEEDLTNSSVYASVGEYVEKTFNEQFKSKPEILNDKKKYLHHLELFRISLESAESWYNVTFDGNQYENYPGDQMVNWKDRGYSTILDILMKRYPDPTKELPVLNNTILNTEVMSIDYLESNEGAPVMVTTTKGELYRADHVIVTVSLGLLKEKHQSMFIPPLPDYKAETIDGLGFGNVAKIYLLFEKPFWELGDKRVLHFTFIWNDADRKLVEDDPEKMWILGISGVVTLEHKPNLLLLWISGKYAKAMEAISEDKVFDHSMETLHRFLDKKYNVTKPMAMLRSRWYSNPYFRGTYSYRSVETQKRKVSAEILEKPLTQQNPKILFAGEATSKHRYGTVDGAIGSGWKEANRLLNHYKNLLMNHE